MRRTREEEGPPAGIGRTIEVPRRALHEILRAALKVRSAAAEAPARVARRDGLPPNAGPVNGSGRNRFRPAQHGCRKTTPAFRRRNRLGSRFSGSLLGAGRTGDALSLIHISEPTRLRRSSYAVFCLKKKNRAPTQTQRGYNPPPRSQTCKQRRSNE